MVFRRLSRDEDDDDDDDDWVDEDGGEEEEGASAGVVVVVEDEGQVGMGQVMGTSPAEEVAGVNGENNRH